MAAEKSTTPAVAFIRTKLNRPRVSRHLIERTRLADKLDRSLSRQVTLICAPAGYGKTSLAVAWLEDHETPSAWLSLNESDNDLGLFVRYLVAALQTVAPDALSATGDIQRSEYRPDTETIASTLINDIADLPHTPQNPSLTLVLDDYHCIHNQDIHELLTSLIEHQPHQLHLMILSRLDPLFLPLVQLRAAGQIQEVRRSDLRFTAAETRDFFDDALTTKLSGEVVEGLDRRIEGWAVGLQLASLSLQAADDPESSARQLAASPQFATEYLLEEVIKHQPQAVQDFLLKTSILDRMCGDLCAAVALPDKGRTDGETFLAELERTNVFVAFLDDDHGWYRYHHLFQSMLVGRLEAVCTPSEIEELHQRASRWFARAGLIEEAIHHALLSKDIDAAVALVEQNSQDLINGTERQTLERWLNALPQERAWQSPTLLLAQAWMLVRQWRLNALVPVVDRLEDLVSGKATLFGGQSIGVEMLIGPVRALQSFIYYTLNLDPVRGVLAGSEALEILPGSAGGIRGAALLSTALSKQALGEQSEALHLLNDELMVSTPSGSSTTQAYAALCLIHRNSGDVTAMATATDRFLAHASHSPDPNTSGASNWFAGLLHYELNDLDAANVFFSRSWDSRYQGNFPNAVNSGLGLVRIHQLRGELGLAQNIIDTVRSSAQQLQVSILLRDLDASQAEQWLLSGETLAALRWMKSWSSKPALEPRIRFQLSALIAARIAAEIGAPDEIRKTADILQAQLAIRESHHNIHRTVEILTHMALLEERVNERERALSHLSRAVALAETSGLVRSLVDGGPRLRPLLQLLSEQGVAPSYLPYLLESQPWSFDETQPAQEKPALTPSSIEYGIEDEVESLTRREGEVLRQLQTGMTDQEIALELVIAVPTVMRHASNIYGKLGVKNRTQAVRKAQALGLLQ